MNQRIQRLRQLSLEATPTISLERAELITEFYKNDDAQGVSAPVARALAFKHILRNKSISIDKDELIVGERGPVPKATPTYPEICAHTQQDFRILNDREKISFSVDDKTFKYQDEQVFPYWSRRCIRHRIMESMEPEWLTAYESGIFTEFMEQRAPGHTVLDDKIYKKGFLDFKEDIYASINKLDFDHDPMAFDKHEELKAMAITADAIIEYAERHSECAQSLAEEEDNPERKKELMKIARICERVPAHAPSSFHEALQYYWFVHLGVITELNTWDAFNPGRLDRHLLPFYRADLESGDLTEDDARELLQAFWIKFNNQPAPPKVGVTAEESNTYTDFCLINLGGVDSNGNDAVNELTYIILDVIEEMRILQPSSMIQLSKKNSDRFLHRALKIIKTGFGQPSIFNTDAIIAELIRQGKTVEDARNGGASGCVETGAFGKESYILTGYFNLTKVLEITLFNGINPVKNKKIGIETGDPANFSSFDDMFEAFQKQLNHFINIKIKGNLVIERLYATMLPAPFLSILVDDCVKQGIDYNAGGARYNTSYIQGVGLGSLTDCLSAINEHVFVRKTLGLDELISMMKENYDNNEEFRQILMDETPRYGNDNDKADSIMRRIFEAFFEAVDGRPNTKGGNFRINLLPTTSHVYFGSVLGAMPDGRKRGEPLSEGISPVQGADRHGPTAVIKSAAKIDHIRTGGTLLNQKFSPQIMESEEGITKVGQLVRSYFRMDGHHIQFNVISAETLRAAQREPWKYRDLIVRVAGYSDYFVDLVEDLQDEIIRRTEHN
ncbi:MAG: glycyl radical protein [Candidatus Electryonea clarkiae]|nr:glycyl radical protein [Candidatus Electryonea clarkiae]MDP8285300.1 glycyl radical protein [Candidatus Electryonea clarkiae]